MNINKKIMNQKINNNQMKKHMKQPKHIILRQIIIQEDSHKVNNIQTQDFF